MQADVQTKNFKESSGICFSREDKAVAGLRGARDWSKSKRGGAGTVLSKSKRREAARVWSKNNRGESSEIVQGRQPPIQTGNSKESSGICFSREDKAVAGLGPAAYWRYVRSPRSDTNAVCPPENKFRSLGSHERKQVELLGAGSSPITARAGIFGLERGDKRYELSNHLGNVLTVVSDRRAKASCADTLVSGYWADVVSTNDYYPFGMGMVERGDDGKYRYGFNGMQRDDEWQGAGNAYDFGARMYDGRLGRWMSVDPLNFEFASTSPFNFALNTPFQAVDPDGAKTIFVNGYWNPKYPSLAGAYPEDAYWGRGAYIRRAQEVLNDVNNSVQFVDGRGPWNGSPVDRYESGYEYAKANFSTLTADMKRDKDGNIVETLKFVSHSQGGAYSEGMIKYLEEKGVVVETVVHLSTFQPLGFAASESPNTFQMDLAWDGLTSNNRIPGVDRYGIVNYEGPASYAHAFTKFESETWDMVEDLIKFPKPMPVIIDTGSNPGFDESRTRMDNTRVRKETTSNNTLGGSPVPNGTDFSYMELE